MRLINDHHNCDDFVTESQLYRYTVKCFCGETWGWTTSQPRSSRQIADMMAEEAWSLDDNDHPMCTKCLRRVSQGLRPKDPDNLGPVQQDVLKSLREHGWWSYRCGWLWGTPSYTIRVLKTLVNRGLVEVNEGVYTPV